MRSNNIPGFSFHRLTCDRGAMARLDRQALRYVPEGRRARGLNWNGARAREA
jgi:hypothetical protein